VTGLALGLRSLTRYRLRTGLSIAGIAITAAMLLDMVMLSGSIERTFAEMLLSRGYQIRVSPKGTLPFDTEASFPHAGNVVATLRADPAVEAAGAVLGASVYGRTARDSLVTLFGYGIQPEAQALYQLQEGADLAPRDTLGILLSGPAAEAFGTAIGDTVVLVGRLDPQTASPAVERRLVARGIVRWIYDSRGQRSIGTTLPVMQRLAGTSDADRASPDPASIVMVKVRNDAGVAAVTERLRAAFPRLEVNSVADLVVHFRRRLVYFRQLAYILGTLSLGVTVLLVTTLLTITVNERLGEIATLRAIGVSRKTVVRQVLAEGVVLTVVGGGIGMLLGFATARYLDGILTSFPGLPAAFSFFVPRADTIAVAVGVLVATGSLAGVYPAWLAARAPIAATLRSEAM
jgi:putative ABC transport system permease protein